ncbi:hypothetical protein [Streptomyces sp. MBT62]|uniref:hypothetical protein n=1 Tax=Streptomyces sp. MBT62 TaxID=2800410 RepID=UPI0027DAE2EA|nr:hypothetical protein [Streptomyces sp. MBT62]
MRIADIFGDICPQRTMSSTSVTMSEDCLNLNSPLAASHRTLETAESQGTAYAAALGATSLDALRAVAGD